MSLKYIFKFKKTGYVRLIGHLDLLNLFARSIKRCDYELLYFGKYNPKPRISISNPLSLGYESLCEFLQVELKREIQVEEFILKLNEDLPEGLKILEGALTDIKSLQKHIGFSQFLYIFPELNLQVDDFGTIVKSFFEKEKIYIDRYRKMGSKKIPYKIDVKPLIFDYRVGGQESDLKIYTRLTSEEGAYLNPGALLKSFLQDAGKEDDKFNRIDSDFVHILRLNQYDHQMKEIRICKLKDR